LCCAPHTHAGKAYAPGDAIAVSPAIADWLIAQGIAQRAATTDATRTPLETDYEEVGTAAASPSATKTPHRLKEPKA
jgi:hypothetical protein